MAAKRKHANAASVAETLAAEAFLRSIDADWQNQSLVLSVVAWERTAIAQYAPKGDVRYVSRNNPFLMHPGRWDAAFRKGTFQTMVAGRRTGLLSSYKNLTDALRAMANYLLDSKDPTLKGIVAAFRRATGKDASRDTLSSIALSSWDVNHYGQTAQGYITGDALFHIYNSLTGDTHMVTTKAKAPPAPPKAAPMPQYLAAHFQPLRYVSAYAAAAFYRARHQVP